MSASAQTENKMEYVRLGNSGLKISKLVLGCMSYGSKEWQGWVLPEEEGIEHIKAAYDLGINAFDTANVYSNGLSEVILGKAIKKYNLPREEIVVMTKLFFLCGRTYDEYTVGYADPDSLRYTNQYGLSRKHIFDSVKASLERLQLDYIDVLQCHRFDNNTPIEETMQALNDVVKAGYVRYIGMSSCHAYQFHIMQNYAITNHLTPFISMQNHYNLLYREEEREMFPTIKHFGVGSLPWSPIARGRLTRPLSAAGTKRADSDDFAKVYGNEEVINRVEKVAKDHGASMAQIALAWVLGKEGVAAPVIGSTSLQNIKDLAGAIKIKLTPEEMKYLEEAYAPQPVLGHM